MAVDVVKVILGVPGPGGGVTVADLAAYMPKSGGTFTGAPTFKPSSDGTGFVLVEKADGTDLILVDTTNGRLKLVNGCDLQVFSDNGITQVALLDGATGNLNLSGLVTATGGRFVGDKVKWGFVFNEGGAVLTTGVKIDYPVPYPTKITGWELVGGVAGNLVIDVWHDSYPNFAPTVGDSIAGAEKPTLSGVIKNTDTSLNSGNGWNLTEDFWLRFNIDSVATVTRATLKLFGVRL